MADRKSMIQTLNDFSKKIQAMSLGAEFSFQKETSAMKSLQNQINQHEEDRLSYLQSRFSEYLNPVTQDIEQDEEYINQFVDNPENTLFISALDGDGIDKINEIIDTIEKIDRTPEIDEEELDYY